MEAIVAFAAPPVYSSVYKATLAGQFKGAVFLISAIASVPPLAGFT